MAIILKNLSIVIYMLHSFVSAQIFTTLKHTHLIRNYTNLIMEDSKSQCDVLKKSLSEWSFSTPKLLLLPIDKVESNYIRRNVIGAVFSKVSPTPLKHKISLVSYSKDALINILDMDPSITESEDFTEFVSGNLVLSSSVPLAHRYGGHQFGTWAMQLGDGRAHLLGEYINNKGEHWELQLKGSGMTPYSRDGDGRAVLRSSIREFLCSEAMHYLGVPTSRAAALVVSNDPVLRDQFYNGFPELEKAAVVLRLAPTWFRFGSLELLARQGEVTTLKILTDFIIQEHFPSINPLDEDRYLQMFDEVSHKTLQLVAQWQGVGFTHGVLNTDNMSLLSVTIDYGPFGYLDAYHERYIPNNSDKEGRYCYGRQPEIVIWNLEKLARALSVLLNQERTGQLMEMVKNLQKHANDKLSVVFRKKLGLTTDQPGDLQLTQQLLNLMQETSTDFTMGFCQLGEVQLEHILEPEHTKEKWALETLKKAKTFQTFIEAYKKRIALEPELTESKRQALMKANNPRYVLRQWMAQSAIKKAENYDFSEVNLLLKVLQTPFSYQEEAEEMSYSSPPPCWARHIKVSCSS
ncbi:hypothetical protein R5R35_006368 [Gryllus longicercus]|uniref:Selenoprotein O n=2 Tax=Gryllus longicercus TaxID=2509291 RepID=A0AAN9ZGA3_9ORTH